MRRIKKSVFFTQILQKEDRNFTCVIYDTLKIENCGVFCFSLSCTQNAARRIAQCGRKGSLHGYFSVLTLLGGLALFLFGMNTMGGGLERLSGGRLERTLEK